MKQTAQWPSVKKLTLNDLAEVIVAGIQDFRAAPQFGLCFGSLYVLAGWLIIILLWYLGWVYLAYPLAMGFALIAPFAAVGFYAVSEHLEKGKPLSWSSILDSIGIAARRDLRWMALVTGFALVLWMDIAAFLFFGFVGLEGFHADFLATLFASPSGLIFLVVGNVVGALIALLIFSISVVSFPMLYERDIDFVTAMVTSVQLVLTNPLTMIVWCVLIGISVVISVLSMFIGLFIVLPIVGHTTWHLYRRAVEPEER